MKTSYTELTDADAQELASTYRRLDDALIKHYRTPPAISAEAKIFLWESLVNASKERTAQEMRRREEFASVPLHLLNSIIILCLIHARPIQDFEMAFGLPPYVEGKAPRKSIGNTFLSAFSL